MISLGNVKKSWSGFDLHLDVSCSADGITVLLGESGAGKSSVLRLIAGFEKPDTGSILLSGVDITRQPPEVRRVGVVFQDYALFPHLNVEANIAFGIRSLPAAQRRARVAELLDLTGLAGFEKRSVTDLSGGEQQRVALARALAPSPGVLLLDEPFSAIDPERREDLGQYLVALQRRLAIPMIFVTHSRSEALQIASTIVLLRGGRLIEAGEPRELYSRPRFEYTARFLGPLAALGGETWKSLGLSDRVPAGERAMLRPEEFEIRIDAAGAFEVAASLYRGWDSLYILRPGNAEGEGEGVEIPVRSTMDLQPGQRCALVAKAQPRILEPPPPLWY